MEQEQTKRGPGRPRTGRKPRIDATVSQEVADFLDDLGQQGMNVSAFLDRLVKSSQEYRTQKKGSKPMLYYLKSNQSDRINLDEFAATRGREDAMELGGDFDVTAYANQLVDESLENEELTDDPEEFRTRFVDAYIEAFNETRKANRC